MSDQSFPAPTGDPHPPPRRPGYDYDAWYNERSVREQTIDEAIDEARRRADARTEALRAEGVNASADDLLCVGKYGNPQKLKLGDYVYDISHPADFCGEIVAFGYNCGLGVTVHLLTPHGQERERLAEWCDRMPRIPIKPAAVRARMAAPKYHWWWRKKKLSPEHKENTK